MAAFFLITIPKDVKPLQGFKVAVFAFHGNAVRPDVARPTPAVTAPPWLLTHCTTLHRGSQPVQNHVEEEMSDNGS